MKESLEILLILDYDFEKDFLKDTPEEILKASQEHFQMKFL